MIHLTRPELRFAVDAVTRASELTRQVHQESKFRPVLKEDNSPVTVADLAAQVLVAQLMLERFPEERLVAEESSAVLKSRDGKLVLKHLCDVLRPWIPDLGSECIYELIDRGQEKTCNRFWTLDPVDGTKGFLRGKQWAVAMALIEDGKVQIAVLGCPNLSRLDGSSAGPPGFVVAATRGEGSWARALGTEEWTPLQVSSCREQASARILRSYEPAHTDLSRIERLAAFLKVQQPLRAIDSQAKYAVLSSGAAELLVRFPSSPRSAYREKIWDHAAGSLLVEESGGRVTDLDGMPLDFGAGRHLEKNRGILASNGHLHDITLRAIAEL